MQIFLINLLYFVIALPIVGTFFLFLARLNRDKEPNRKEIVLVLSIMLFLIRFFLIFFGATIGIMPYLIEDVLFYSLLTILGVIMTFAYITKIEKVSDEEIGLKSESPIKDILVGVLGLIPLIAMFPLLLYLTDIEIIYNFTVGKIIVGSGFAILGAVYEEIMFRGIIQNHLRDLLNNKLQVIVYTALIFTLTHLFYLPFTAFGIYYIFVFVMALLLSILREKYSLISASILHGLIVFILIIFV